MRTTLLALLIATPALAQTPAQLAHNFWNTATPPAALAAVPTHVETGAFTPASLARLANSPASRSRAPDAPAATAFSANDLARLLEPTPAPAPQRLASAAHPHG